MEQQQKQAQEQSAEKSKSGLGEMLGTIAEMLQMKRPSDSERKVTCHIDMHIYGLNVGQFTALNERMKQFFEQLREEGAIAKNAEFSTLATAKDADSQMDDFNRISHELNGLDQAVSHGSMPHETYKAGLHHINERLRKWLDANEFALKMADKHDLDTPEGFASAVEEAKAPEAVTETHFSPEQQATE